MTIISGGALRPDVKGALECHSLVADNNPVFAAYYNLDSWVQLSTWAYFLNYWPYDDANDNQGICPEKFEPDEQKFPKIRPRPSGTPMPT